MLLLHELTNKLCDLQLEPTLLESLHPPWRGGNPISKRHGHGPCKVAVRRRDRSSQKILFALWTSPGNWASLGFGHPCVKRYTSPSRTARILKPGPAPILNSDTTNSSIPPSF